MKTRIFSMRSALAPLFAIGFSFVLVIGLASMPAQAAFAKLPPTGLKVAETTGTNVRVQWTATSGANLYWVRYATNSAMTANKKVVSSTSASKQITGLKPNTTYYVQVRSAKGTTAKHTLLSDYSKPIQARTDAFSLSPPSSFRIDYALKNSLGISWKFVNNADSYRIEVVGGGKTRYIRHKDTSTLMRINYEITGLEPNVKYRVRVRGLEQKVNPSTGDYYDLTGWTAAKEAQTPGVVTGYTEVSERPPHVPTLTTISSTSIGIEWAKREGSAATGYRLQFWSSKDTKRRYLSMPDRSATERYFVGSIPSDSDGSLAIRTDATYYFRIAAVKAGGPSPQGIRISDYSSEADFRPKYLREPPKNLTASAPTGDSMLLTWDPVVGATRYRVDWTKTPNPTGGCEESDNSCTLITPANLNAPSHRVTNLDAGRDYYFRVSAVASSTISDFQPKLIKATTLADQPQTVVQVPNDTPSATAVTLTWHPGNVGSPTSYQLRYSTDAGMKSPTTVSVGNVLKHRINGLRAETNYMMQVRGRYANGTYTGWSVITSTHTRPLRGAITGRVNPAEGVSNSHRETVVYAYNSKNDVGGVARPAADGSFTIWDLPPGTWKIRYEYFGASNVTSPWLGSGSTPVNYYSQGRSISTTNNTVTIPALTPPTGISISGAVTGTRCLAGTRVTALSDNSTVSGAKDEVLGDTKTGSNGSYTLTGLLRNEGYWVRFVSSCGTKSVQVTSNRTASNVHNVNTAFDSTSGGNATPSQIGGFKATNVSSSGATISWTPVADAVAYRVYWSPTSSMPSACEPRCHVEQGTSASMPLSRILSGNKAGGNTTPTAGSTYYIKVSAINAAGKTITGWQSSPFKVVLPAGGAATPSVVSGLGATDLTVGGATLSWDTVPTATKYRVFVRTANSFPSKCEPDCWVITPTTSGSKSSVTLESLIVPVKGQRYYFKVSAINAAGKTITGWQSTASSFTLPSAVTGLSATGITSSDATVSWTPVPGATSYRIYWSPTAAMPGACEPRCQVVQGAVSSRSLSAILSGNSAGGNAIPTAGQSYYIKVSAINSSGRTISSWQDAPLRVTLAG